MNNEPELVELADLLRNHGYDLERMTPEIRGRCLAIAHRFGIDLPSSPRIHGRGDDSGPASAVSPEQPPARNSLTGAPDA